MTDLGIAIDTASNTYENGLAAPTDKPKRRSMRAAINQHCKDCTYDAAFRGGGTWREQVSACGITKCALWELRPISKPKKGSAVEEESDDE